MNKVVPWLKSNWIIVVLSVLILASLPTALYFSSKMNRNLRESFQAQVKADEQAIAANTLQYTIASPIPGIADVEHRGPANQVLIDWFAQQRERIRGEAQQVWAAAAELNRAGHDLLMNGLFPAPPPGADDRVARADFISRYLALPDEFMRTLKAGPPPDSAALVAMLSEQAERRREQVISQIGQGELPKEHLERIIAELAALRRAEYRRRAEEINVYADRTVFRDVPAYSADQLRDPPTLAYCWQWQEAAWVMQDLVKAIAAANASRSASENGEPRPGVYGSVVKRIIGMRVVEAETPAAADSESGPRRSSARPGLVATNPAISLTGRFNSPDNQLYDVRLAQLEVIVDTRRLPILLDAIAATNLMTVLDLDIEQVEPAADLLEGYDYGPDHVVKARLIIETIWFREWIVPYMPADEKRLRGVEEPEKQPG
jgi:hypothetical protein